MMPCPLELDKTPSRCDQDFDTNFVFQDTFGGAGFKIKHREEELLQTARVLGRGCLNAGTLVCQVFHWHYADGNPRARATTPLVQLQGMHQCSAVLHEVPPQAP